ncbi:aldo/keto reductase [Streptomyces wuyuanensis]|uniref:aldo/keto reductase n=1 Tax=Streptomyces wuyuanensis TaxID=1196353 RepID=UPI00344357EF
MTEEHDDSPSEDAHRQPSAWYRANGRSGLHMSAIGISLQRYYGHDESTTVMRSLLDGAISMGINHIDTAPQYGPPYGAAEENFGRLLPKLSRQREELVIATQAGLGTQPGPFAGFASRKRVVASLEASLRRMGLEYVDVFYVHRHDPFTPLEETMGALDWVVRQGKALYVGLSGYAPALLQKGASMLNSMGTPLTTCKVSYSMRNRWPEYGLFDVLEESGFGCVTEGTLDLETDPLAGSSESVDEALQLEFEASHRHLARIAEARGQTPAQCAISWTLRRSCMTSVLTHPSSMPDLVEYAAALKNTEFTDAELSAIAECFTSPEELY